MTKPNVITITACGRSYGKATAVLKWWESLSPVERRMLSETLFRRRKKGLTPRQRKSK